MNDKKMSDVFDLPVSIGKKAASHASAILDGCGTFGIINDQAMKHSCHAINNHDRLTEENKQLREMLSRDRTAFLNQIELELIRDSAKQETQELADSIYKLLNK